MKCVSLSEIRVDGGTQPREAIDQGTVDEYAEAMGRLERFPPVVVYHDGESTWLADGFHRYYAARAIGASALEADWRVGTIAMAKLYAASANTAHGLRRTTGDKRRAIEMVLSTSEGRTWTQEQIAQHCNVARSWVAEVTGKCRTDSPQKNPQAAKLTKREEKRARIAEAAAANPAASHSALARKLGVDRETVAAVRARARATGAAPPKRRGLANTGGLDPPAAPASFSDGYSTAIACTAARAVLEAARAARARMTEDDWKVLVREVGNIE